MPLAQAKPVAMVTTRDRKIAEPFYADTLGLPRREGDAFAAVFDCAGIELRLTEVPDHLGSPHPVLGWEVDDIVATIDALEAKGLGMTVYPGMGMDTRGIWTGPDGAKVAFFADPDGNALTLKQGG